MAGDSIGFGSRRKSKKKIFDKNGKNDNNDDLLVQQLKTIRGGLRVYKIVILGDGGVGKSGKFSFVRLFDVLNDVKRIFTMLFSVVERALSVRNNAIILIASKSHSFLMKIKKILVRRYASMLSL